MTLRRDVGGGCDDRHRGYCETAHFVNLDGLRFICIAAVLWHHSPALEALGSDASILHRGFLGVDLFFILSGFLITMLLLREEGRAGTISLSKFYWRRLLRIVPPYFLVVTVVSAYWILAKGRWDLLELVPFYYAFLSNFLVEDIPLLAITWSLSVEEQFYMLWPAVMAATLATTGRRVRLLLAGVALNVLAISGAFSAFAPAPLSAGPLILRLPNATYAPLLIGALLAVALHDRRSFAALEAVLGRRIAAPTVFGLLVLALAWLPADLRGWPNLVLHTLMAAALATLVIPGRTSLDRVLCAPLVVRIGMVSYGIYLYHHLARHIAVEGLSPLGVTSPWAVTAGMVVLSIFFAELSYRTFEAAFRRMRNGPPVWSLLGRFATARDRSMTADGQRR